jgi:hypothetical protein
MNRPQTERVAHAAEGLQKGLGKIPPPLLGVTQVPDTLNSGGILETAGKVLGRPGVFFPDFFPDQTLFLVGQVGGHGYYRVPYFLIPKNYDKGTKPVHKKAW